MDTINNSNNKIHEKYKFEAARYNMTNKNLNLIYVFANLNKPYGKMAMSQKIKEWYTEILYKTDIDGILLKTDSIKIFLDMIKERLGEDKDYYEAMYAIKKHKLIVGAYYKHKLEKVLESLPIIDEMLKNNNILQQAIKDYKQNTKVL